MLGKFFFEITAGVAFDRIRTKYHFLYIISTLININVYNKTYYKISVNLFYLTLFKEKKIKTDKTKQNKTFIKFKIN